MKALIETLLNRPELSKVYLNENGEWSFFPREGFKTEIARDEVLEQADLYAPDDKGEFATANFGFDASDLLTLEAEKEGLAEAKNEFQTEKDEFEAAKNEFQTEKDAFEAAKTAADESAELKALKTENSSLKGRITKLKGELTKVTNTVKDDFTS